MPINNIYIDELYIETNGGNPFTGLNSNDTYLGETSSSLDTHTSNTIGYKWMLQITNGSGSPLNLNNFV